MYVSHFSIKINRLHEVFDNKEQLIKRFWYTRNSPRWGDTISRLHSLIMKLNHTRVDYFSLILTWPKQIFSSVFKHAIRVDFSEWRCCFHMYRKGKNNCNKRILHFPAYRKGGGVLYKDRGKDKSYRFEEN